MADFCRQCSIELFGEDFKDLAGLCKEGEVVTVICEGCGYTTVDCDGNCCDACAGSYPDNDKHPTEERLQELIKANAKNKPNIDPDDIPF